VKARGPRRRFAWAGAVAVACACLHPGCAERIGKKAAQGAVSELQRQHDQNPDRRPIKIAAASAVEGAVEALDTPEQRARIERLLAQAIAAAAQTAVREATREMVVSLGPDGQGPLATSLSRTGENLATSAVGGVGAQLASLVPECAGPDQLDCIERRLQRTARSTAASFTSGVKETLGWQLMLVAFVLGAGGGVLASWLWSLRQYRRRGLREARAV
jgi:hypothetical protein